MSRKLEKVFGWPYVTTSSIPAATAERVAFSGSVGKSSELVRGASYMFTASADCYLLFGVTGATVSATACHIFMAAGVPFHFCLPQIGSTATFAHVIQKDEAGSLFVCRMMDEGV